jgi:hypothetical protein
LRSSTTIRFEPLRLERGVKVIGNVLQADEVFRQRCLDLKRAAFLQEGDL